jgi:hypothetical protein
MNSATAKANALESRLITFAAAILLCFRKASQNAAGAPHL